MSQIGTLMLRVYTSRAQLPVPGATVAVTRKAAGGRHDLLAVRITDENGRIAPVEVDTPDQAASASPGTPSPFSVCDVWVEAQGYELLFLENVQLFPGTETLQEAELIPLPEQVPLSARVESVNVTPQEL